MQGQQTITFDLGPGAHQIDLSGTELSITQDLAVRGPGADQLAVSGGDATRVFDIGSGATVTIEGLTITHGLADGSAPGIPSYGGGGLNFGNLTLSDVVVSDNQAIGDINANPMGRGPGSAFGGGV
jgi:hypothetical protein